MENQANPICGTKKKLNKETRVHKQRLEDEPNFNYLGRCPPALLLTSLRLR